MQAGEALHQLDAHDVFRHLVAELPFEAQPQRRAVGNGQRLAVHVIGEDRLRMRSIDQVDALIERALSGSTLDSPSSRVSAQWNTTKRASGLTPRARQISASGTPVHLPMQLPPSTQSCRVIWVRAGRLRSSSSDSDNYARDEAVNLQAPIGEMFVDEIEVVLVLRVG